MKTEVGGGTGNEKESAAMQTEQSLSQCVGSSGARIAPRLSDWAEVGGVRAFTPLSPSVSRNWCPGGSSGLVRQLSAAEADPKAVSGQQVL